MDKVSGGGVRPSVPVDPVSGLLGPPVTVTVCGGPGSQRLDNSRRVSVTTVSRVNVSLYTPRDRKGPLSTFPWVSMTPGVGVRTPTRGVEDERS